MADVKGAIRDMVRQRRVQAATAVIALAGLIAWLMGYALGQYLAAGAIILFTVASVRWIDDEEYLEKEDLGQGKNSPGK